MTTVNFILIILGASLWLYLILAGADLGAGILELFKGKKDGRIQEQMIERAMGPVWEVNHIWLILSIVIFFVGFPKVYTELSIIFHIPLTAMLIGIVFRGTSFAFRHYDAIKDKTQNLYSLIFALSSLWTTLWIGIIIGSLILGNIPASRTDFLDVYVYSWLHPFPLLTGLFLCSLLAYISATYLVAESPNSRISGLFRRRAIKANICSIFFGGSLFLYAHLSGITHLQDFFKNRLSLTAFGLSTLLLFFQWHYIKKNREKRLRFFGVAQLTLIFLGLLAV
ncbi:MAG TPA: cytochrome d ubiquinol oxidase subunit II, partial [Sulfurimonas sp.]|nr:cytochrome d ubiquinol oxidase subunit II [Sulfurimonas sp.]